MKSAEKLKSEVAKYVANSIKDKEIILLGSGSTVNLVTEQLIKGTKVVSSSRSTTQKIYENDLVEITLDYTLSYTDRVCVDGADLVLLDSGIIIKGHGGALLREKIVWNSASEIYVVIDESKIQKKITKSIPVVISPIAINTVKQKVERLNGVKSSSIFKKDNLPFTTDDGMIIIHLNVEDDTDITKLNGELMNIPGVIETGIFLMKNFAKVSIVCANQDGVIEF